MPSRSCVENISDPMGDFWPFLYKSMKENLLIFDPITFLGFESSEARSDYVKTLKDNGFQVTDMF